MPHNPTDHLWNKVASALRVARATVENSVERTPEPPFGFQTRVIALAREARREKALALWRRWTLRTACFSVVVFGMALFQSLRSQTQDDLMQVPVLEFPQPPAP